MCPALKSDVTTYVEYMLCYIYDVLAISANPEATMKGIQAKLKLKDNKIEEHKVYLDVSLSNDKSK